MEGLERIKVLGSEITDEYTLRIINYLLSRNDMNDKYLNDEKSLKQMLSFVGSEIRKKFKPIDIGNGIKMVATSDEEVYNLAIHYFDETNEELGLQTKKVNKVDHVIENENDDDIEENQEEATNTVPIKPLNQIKNKNVPEGQLNIFEMI